jgi:hypothetical protein
VDMERVGYIGLVCECVFDAPCVWLSDGGVGENVMLRQGFCQIKCESLCCALCSCIRMISAAKSGRFRLSRVANCVLGIVVCSLSLHS